jgi:hypothetical protein
MARRLLPLLIALALLGGCVSSAGEPEPPATLSIRGKITPELLDQLALLVPQDAPPQRAIVYLSSGGGEFHTALKIAQWLERVPDSTAVVSRVCDSSCVVIFAAARKRLVDGNAVFGVHSPRCTIDGLLGLTCRAFWEPWARSEFHARVTHISPRWAAYLDAQEPPALAREGADLVRVTGSQLIAFGAAAPLNSVTLRAALNGE